MIITIDGPVASGKTTAGRNLASVLGFTHLDSGAIYRSIALLALRSGVEGTDADAVSRMLATADIRLDGERVFLSGEDVSEYIRTPEITRAVRPFAENPDVRTFVKQLQRCFAEGKDIVVEGRDMGTVVFPDAEVKFFLTSSDEERARRRWQELEGNGTPQDYETVLAELRERDRADRTREIAPLSKPEGAIEVDSTGWTSEETLAFLESCVRGVIGGRR